MRPAPKIINSLFSSEDFLLLKNNLWNIEKTKNNYSELYGRYTFEPEILKQYSEKIIPIAKQIFNSESLVSSYSLFSHYEGEKAKLRPHVDRNACTYTVDLCVYQNDPWDLWVEGKPYTLRENDALAYYGNDQIHWRKDFPNKESNVVAMVFFHFVEPDHWYIKHGKDYLTKHLETKNGHLK